MWPFRRRERIWITGEDALARRLQNTLTGGRRTAKISDPERLLRHPPGAGETLILADPPDPETLCSRIAGRLAARGARRRPRVILVHRRDPAPDLGVWASPGSPTIETHALEDRAARALFIRWPLHLGLDPLFGQRPHLLIVGFAPPARALLVQALRLMHYGKARGRVTVLTDAAERERHGFEAAYPQAGEVAELHWAPLADATWAGGPPPVTQVLICLHDPEHGLDTARHVRERIARTQGVSPPILLEIGDAEPEGALADWDGQIRPVSHLALACDPAQLLTGHDDRVARAIHEHYLDSIAAQGRDPGQEPAGQPWERLAVSYREANRHQADHLWAKLALTDCRAVPEESVEQFAFSPAEAERLAVVEHQRWAAGRYLDGWSYAPVRDNARKHHPQLIPYPELSDAMKDLDRFAVRGVPALLARSGLAVIRMLILGLAPALAGAEAGAGSGSDAAASAAPASPGGDWGRLPRLTDQVLHRLLARYPDHSLVIAADLADPRARLVARRALERAGAQLLALHPRPIAETLARTDPDGSNRSARRDLLWLLARAERHIPLPGEGEIARWLAARAHIHWHLGPACAPAPEKARVVSLPVGGGPPLWNFEY